MLYPKFSIAKSGNIHYYINIDGDFSRRSPLTPHPYYLLLITQMAVSDYDRGYNTGRKARQQNRPEPMREGRSPEWIEGMIQGYKPTKTPASKVKITIAIDDALRQEAIALGINRSQACEMGLKMAVEAVRGSPVGAGLPLTSQKNSS